MSLDERVIDQVLGKIVTFRVSETDYVGIVKAADNLHVMIGPYQAVSRNQTIDEAVNSLKAGSEPYFRHEPADYGNAMFISAATPLYVVESKRPKKKPLLFRSLFIFLSLNYNNGV